ncbi:hypothetical protein HHE06_07480 [Helicobacter heilmannii]|nr:hypothetical protein HHE06_07480 [Helicobacter heilmannii]
MGAIASLNFKHTKMEKQEKHNDRLRNIRKAENIYNSSMH